MSARPIQVVIDCANPAGLAEFWADALGYVVEPPPPGFATWEAFAESIGIPSDQWDRLAAVVDPERERPRLLFQKVPEPSSACTERHVAAG